MLDSLFKAIYDNLKIISLLFISASLLILAYFMTRSLIGLDKMFPAGTNMVDKEIVFIPHFLYMKPITLTIFLGYTGILAGLLHLDKSWGYNLSEYEYVTLEIVIGFLLFACLYEVLFNFTLWSALISSIAKNGEVYGNIDLLINKFPNPNQPWNLVFATKIFYAFSLTLATSLYFVEKWRRLSKKC